MLYCGGKGIGSATSYYGFYFSEDNAIDVKENIDYMYDDKFYGKAQEYPYQVISEKEDLEYKIVGSTEANSLKGKISNESPVGRALIGLKVGQTATVETPGGVFKYKVLEIQRAGA